MADIETSKFVYANPAMCKMLGYSLEELWGMDRSAIHPEDEWNRIAAEIEAQAGGRTEMAANVPCTTKDGTTLYVDVNATKALERSPSPSSLNHSALIASGTPQTFLANSITAH